MSLPVVGRTRASVKGSRGRSIVVAATLTAVLASACGAADPDERSATSVAAVPSDAPALLTRVATEGADAVFEAHHVGEVDLGGSRSAYVYVGRSADGAVAYVCDGERGAWFTGSVDQTGAGALVAADGDATLTVTVADDGLRAAVAGGAFDGADAVIRPLDDGEGQLVRLEAASDAGGADAASGGIIVTPDGVRGVLSTSIVDGRSNTLLLAETAGTLRPRILATTTTRGASDGQSNTVIVGEEPVTTASVSDGRSNTVIVGEEPVTTASVSDGRSNTVIVGEEPVTTASVSDGRSNTILVAETETGALSVRVRAPADDATTTTEAPPDTTPTVSCDAATPVVDELVLALEVTRATTQHRLEGVERRRADLIASLEAATEDQRPTIEDEIALRDRRMARLSGQIERIDEQIAALEAVVAPCRT